MEANLRGRTALVTGASRGIGQAIAMALAHAGADVAGLARDLPALERTERLVRELGRDWLSLPADLADPAQVERAAEAAWAWRGTLRALVNAAGTSFGPAFDPETWDRSMAVNVRAPFQLSLFLGPRMRQAGGGSIINIASISAEVATGSSPGYAASKAALVAQGRALAVRWAPEVRVNAIGPGYVRTEMNERWLAEPGNLDWVLQSTPAGRLGRPEDVADLAVFLASEQSAYLTGQHILLDGGWTAR
ncbi:MAG: SDR family oxidoreductase [Candidatus Dormibacteraeota bacterium]|nr:SDR family oxidoreductase [Candidatus Dormibacteraeota bacterium]